MLRTSLVSAAAAGLLATVASAQPRITSLGQPVSPAGVNAGGGRVIASTNCGLKSFEVGVATISLADVNSTGTPAPAFGAYCLSGDGSRAWGSVAYPSGSITGITTTNNTVAGSWNQSTNTWLAMPGVPADPATNLRGTGSSGNSTALTSVRGMSLNGRYVVGQGNVYATTAVSGWPISGTTFVTRPFIWDTQTNTVKNLPTPPHATIANRWRDGRAICVSNDASVVFGGSNPNVSGTNGGQFAVWYLQGDGSYVAEPNGQLPTGSGDIGRQVDGFCMTSDGLTIVGTSFDNTDLNGLPIPGTPPANTHTFITKWTRPDVASRTWTRTKLYDYSTSQTSATPGSISSWWQAYDCQAGTGNPPSYPDPNFLIGGISDDAGTIVGDLVYSTCSGFVRGGFIWKAGAGPGTGMFDLYDYLVSLGTIDISNYGMVGTIEAHAGASLGYPRGISPDGNTIVGYAGPFTPLGPAWTAQLTGASAKPPFIACAPANVVGFTRCSSPTLQFGFAAGGSGTLTYQWYKGTPPGGTMLSNGQQPSPSPTGLGSEISGVTTFLMRVNYPNLSDAGDYYCAVTSSETGVVNSPVASATAAIATALPNDLCSTVSPTNIFLCASATDSSNELSYDACAAYIDEFRGGNTSCLNSLSFNDVWFKYTPAADGFVRIENCASTYFSSVITVYDNCPSAGGAELANACSTTGGNTLPSCSKVRINRLEVHANVPIWIRVANQLSTPGTPNNTGRVRIYPAPAIPSNDACAAATEALPGPNAFDTSEASYDSNDIFGSAGPSCSTALSRDVWFKFTPLVRGTLKGSTCTNQTDLNAPLTTPNTVLTAYTACGGTEVPSACNDNSTRGTCGATTGTLTTSVNTSFVTVGQVAAGQTTWFRIGGNSATSTAAIGPGTFTILFAATPCNAADVARLGGAAGADGLLTADDIIFYLDQFFANNLAVADLVGLGGAPNPPDGAITADDLIYFLNQFFLPCNP